VWRQWKWLAGGLGAPMRLGLDWCQVEAMMRLRGIGRRRRAGIVGALRIMEEAALECLATGK
jgi:hypothetical protein